MKKMTLFTLFIISIVSVFLYLLENSHVFALMTLYFCMLAVSPWAYASIIAACTNNTKILKTLLIASVSLAFLGFIILIDVMYIHPDNQGGLLFIWIPVWQLLFLLLTSPLLWFFREKNR